MEIGISLIILVVLAITIIFTSIKMVPQGYAYTVERFGKYTHTLRPGLHVIVPFIDSVGSKQLVMEQVLNVPPQEVISRDNATVEADGVAYYQVINAEKAAYEIADIQRALENLVMTNIRAVLGSMELDEMLSSRDRINSEVQIKLDEATDPWGIKITRVELKNINPPDDLKDAMNKQMMAEREKRAVVLRAEGERAAAIAVAEGEKQSEILRAEGERNAAFLEAEAREREAEAEAKATATVSRAIAEGNTQAINYFVAQRYLDALGKLTASENAKVIMVPLEAASVIGSIEGIKELVDSVKTKAS